MKTTVEIDINDYLSDEEKKDIAVSAFRESLMKGLTEQTSHKQNYQNYERVISNSVYQFLETNIDSILDTDTEKLIRDGVEKTIKSQKFEYSLFRSKSAWEKEDSPAQKIVREAVNSHKEAMTEKIKSKLSYAIENIDEEKLYELYTDAFNEFIVDRLTKPK